MTTNETNQSMPAAQHPLFPFRDAVSEDFASLRDAAVREEHAADAVREEHAADAMRASRVLHAMRMVATLVNEPVPVPTAAQVAALMDVKAIADEIDTDEIVEEVAALMDVKAIADEIDTDEIVEEVAETLADNFPTENVAEHIDHKEVARYAAKEVARLLTDDVAVKVEEGVAAIVLRHMHDAKEMVASVADEIERRAAARSAKRWLVRAAKACGEVFGIGGAK